MRTIYYRCACCGQWHENAAWRNHYLWHARARRELLRGIAWAFAFLCGVALTVLGLITFIGQ